MCCLPLAHLSPDKAWQERGKTLFEPLTGIQPGSPS